MPRRTRTPKLIVTSSCGSQLVYQGRRLPLETTFSVRPSRSDIELRELRALFQDVAVAVHRHLRQRAKRTTR